MTNMKDRWKRSDILTIFTGKEQNKMYSTIQELLFFHRNIKESLPQISWNKYLKMWIKRISSMWEQKDTERLASRYIQVNLLKYNKEETLKKSK